MANIISMANSSGLAAQINQNIQNTQNIQNIQNTQINQIRQINQISQVNQISQISQKLNQFIYITNEVKESIDEVTESVEKTESGFSKLGKSLISLGQVAASGIYSAFKEIGTASWNASMEAEKSLNIMKIGTRATGAELNGLMASYEKVGAKVPDSLNTVASVMADVHHSTGATGNVLEDMSGKILSLGSLTGVSVNTIGASLTGTMQSWGIGADQGGEMFDKLYLLSQKSGMGINTLSDKLVKFGGPMRNLGFDFDTSASLIAQWANNGLDADMVLGSFSTALGKMSKHGVKDTSKALENAMNKIKNAKTITEATNWAMEAFGESAGPGMAAAIREGSLEIGTMLDELQNSQGIIDQTSAGTKTLGDKFDTLKNKISLALAPLGDKLKDIAEKVFPIIDKFFDDLSPRLTEAMPTVEKFAGVIGDVLGKTLEGVSTAIKFFIDNLDVFGPALIVFTTILAVGVVPTLWSLAVAQWAVLSPLLLFIGAALAVAAGIALVLLTIKNWGAITDWVGEKWGAFTEWIVEKWGALTDWVGEKWGAFTDWIVEKWGALTEWFVEKWNLFKNYIIGVFHQIGNFIMTYWPYILSLILFAVAPGIAPVVALFIFYFDQIKGFFLGAFESMKAGLGTIMIGIMLVFQGVWDYIKNIITGGSIEQALLTLQEGLIFIKLGILQLFDSLKEYVLNFDLMAAIMDPIRSALAELAILSPEMYQMGANILQGLLNGIFSMKETIWEALKGVADSIPLSIRTFLGIKSPSRVMMEVGLMTSEGLAVGLEDGREKVKLSSENVAETVTAPYNDTSYFSSSNLAINNASPPAIFAASYSSPFSASSNVATTEINPVINITVNGDSSGSTAQDIAERVKLAIQEVFESAARRQGIAGGEAWQL